MFDSGLSWDLGGVAGGVSIAAGVGGHRCFWRVGVGRIWWPRVVVGVGGGLRWWREEGMENYTCFYLLCNLLTFGKCLKFFGNKNSCQTCLKDYKFFDNKNREHPFD